MASSREEWSFWSRLRSRPSAHFPNNTSSRPVLPIDIWSLVDEFTGGPPSHGSRFRSSGSLSYDITDRFWLTNGNREREEKPPERIDTAAVLRRCRKVVYKPSSSIWGKAKAEADQIECPVCLEKLVPKDKLFMLPCSHQFHVDCLTPWIKGNHTCCPCCRADIRRRGPKKDERANTANHNRNSLMNFMQRRNVVGNDLRNERAFGRSGDAQTGTSRHANIVEDDSDAWEGLHDYIMAALAEVDAELNHFMH